MSFSVSDTENPGPVSNANLPRHGSQLLPSDRSCARSGCRWQSLAPSGHASDGTCEQFPLFCKSVVMVSKDGPGVTLAADEYTGSPARSVGSPALAGCRRGAI